MNKNWHNEHSEKMTFGERVADKISSGMGSWTFIIAQTVIVATWLGLNIVAFAYRWDPYPFILLNLVFSTQAAYAAPIIMQSQNRQAQRDRIQAEHDYETNLKAKEEIEELIKQLAYIEEHKIDKLIEWVGIILKSELARVEREAQEVPQSRRTLR